MLVKEHLYKCFVEDSDPVHDMGIGKIKSQDIYNEHVLPGLKIWKDYVESLIGKTLTGKFGNYRVYPRKNVTINVYKIPAQLPGERTIKVVNAEILEDSNIVIEDPEGHTHIMYGDEEYTIK